MISLFPNSYPRYNQIFTRNTINNSILTSKNAMPLKNTTTTDDSVFSIDRNKYTRTYEIVPQNNVSTNHSNISNNGAQTIIGQNMKFNTVASNMKDLKKKWYGNRDASQIVANRRVQAVGNGSMNAANIPLQFVTKFYPHTIFETRRRVRSGGATVPAKVTHKYKNAPIFY